MLILSVRPVQAVEKPLPPRRYVEGALLRALEQVVIDLPLLPYLRRHAVETLWALVRARQAHVRDGARDPAVPILERVDGHEPQMVEPGLEDGVDAALALAPAEESPHLRVASSGLRLFVMSFFSSDLPLTPLPTPTLFWPPVPTPHLTLT